jgi:tetratricopeptide (TPR) repeat protein
MSLFGKLFSRDAGESIDYYEEGVALLNAGQHHEALTSLRLALRNNPDDAATLQQIAVAYTHIGMSDEAVKTYRNALRKDPSAAAARYGLAFLLLHAGQQDQAEELLEAFLSTPPDGSDALRHVEHARSTLARIRGSADGVAADASEAEPEGGADAGNGSSSDPVVGQQEAWPSP